MFPARPNGTAFGRPDPKSHLLTLDSAEPFHELERTILGREIGKRCVELRAKRRVQVIGVSADRRLDCHQPFEDDVNLRRARRGSARRAGGRRGFARHFSASSGLALTGAPCRLLARTRSRRHVSCSVLNRRLLPTYRNDGRRRSEQKSHFASFHSSRSASSGSIRVARRAGM